MDALEFLNKVDRISAKWTTEEKAQYNEYRENHDNTSAIAFVVKWDAEHPVKTRQNEFLKHYPGARILAQGCLNACPMDVFAFTEINCNAQPCFECKKAFWLAEVEE